MAVSSSPPGPVVPAASGSRRTIRLREGRSGDSGVRGMFFHGYGSHCAQAGELTLHTMANAASARLANCATAAVMAIPLAGFYAGFWVEGSQNLFVAQVCLVSVLEGRLEGSIIGRSAKHVEA